MADYTALLERVKRYAAIPRVSGYEGEAAKALAEDFAAVCDRVKIDRIGNVIGTVDGTDPEAPALMIFAHIDTIGFIIRRIDPDGFIRVERMGGVPEKLMQGTPVLVGSEDGSWHPGVIGARSYHTMSAADKEKADSLATLSIDIGAQSEAELHELGIEVGCPVSYYPIFYPLRGDRICGTYLDDALGMAQMVEVAAALKADRPAATVHFVGTVWEEFSARGAMIAARSVKTDLAICILSPGAGDTPDQKGYNNITLGGGPCVTTFNFHGKGTLNGMVVHKGMLELLKESAKKLGINLQRCAMRGALSDSAYLQLEDMGIPVLDMGAPDRYSHSPKEVTDMRVVKETATLLEGFARGLSRDFSLQRY
ncbi:MAG: M20/M25/M40 family metallo-hydrolase [Oscillospiraceae bacterium]|nr:M20/M25/M40 family metallo-hydrolase [Oscillospiraceae bacterium]